jgi:antitoxin ParD1/3/4
MEYGGFMGRNNSKTFEASLDRLFLAGITRYLAQLGDWDLKGGMKVSYFLNQEDMLMPSAIKRTFSLPDEQSEYIDMQVDSGTYGSASEVVRAGLRALQERDAVIERWLIEEVAPTYDKMMANPSRLKSVDEVYTSIRKHHEKRLRENA